MRKYDFLPDSSKPLQGVNVSEIYSRLSTVGHLTVYWELHTATGDAIDLAIEKVIQVSGLPTTLLSPQQTWQ